MKFVVRLAPEAEDELLSIYLQVAKADAAARAEELLDRLADAVTALDRLARRGRAVPELVRVAVREFRELILKPHRIIYEIVGRQVYVHAVLDGRRDLRDLLAERLLR